MIERLRERGWTEQELAYLKESYRPRRESRLFIALMTVLLAAVVVVVPYGYLLLGQEIPFMLLDLVLVVLGVPLGAMFALLMVDLDTLDKVHHVGLLIILPLVIVFTLMALFAKIAAVSSSNALIGGILYAVSFMTPYALLVRYEWNSRIGPTVM